jgi:hypothetical protein
VQPNVRAADRDRVAEPGDRLPQRQLFTVDHGLQQFPGATFGRVTFTIATSTSTAKASIRRSRSCRSRRCPAWASNTARRAVCRIDRSPS